MIEFTPEQENYCRGIYSERRNYEKQYGTFEGAPLLFLTLLPDQKAEIERTLTQLISLWEPVYSRHILHFYDRESGIYRTEDDTVQAEQKDRFLNEGDLTESEIRCIFFGYHSRNQTFRAQAMKLVLYFCWGTIISGIMKGAGGFYGKDRFELSGPGDYLNDAYIALQTKYECWDIFSGVRFHTYFSSGALRESVTRTRTEGAFLKLSRREIADIALIGRAEEGLFAARGRSYHPDAEEIRHYLKTELKKNLTLTRIENALKNRRIREAYRQENSDGPENASSESENHPPLSAEYQDPLNVVIEKESQDNFYMSVSGELNLYEQEMFEEILSAYELYGDVVTGPNRTKNRREAQRLKQSIRRRSVERFLVRHEDVRKETAEMLYDQVARILMEHYKSAAGYRRSDAGISLIDDTDDGYVPFRPDPDVDYNDAEELM